MILSFLVAMIWKSAAIAGSALALAYLVRWRTAADRLILLRAGVAMLLALPLIMAFLPALRITAFPASPPPAPVAAPALTTALQFGPAAGTVSAATIPAAEIDPAIVALLIYALLQYALRYTRIGKQIIAVTHNSEVATALGIHSKRIRLVTFVVGAMFGALGGSLGRESTRTNRGRARLARNYALTLRRLLTVM